MAGHSVWKNIKHRKAAVDAKRGKIWSKLSRAVIVAARTGGVDPKFNSSLRLAILDAKAGNLCDNRSIYLFRAGANNNRTNMTWNT